MADFIFTVSEVNGYVKKSLEAEDLLQNIKIRGEVSNYSKSFAGHVYFTLKDELASVQCVWFAGTAKGAQANIKNGDKIQVIANVTLYIKAGTYQLIIRDVIKDGTGDIYEQFELLKKKLEAEGLFDLDIKKEIPQYPKVVGVITSESGAAIQDIIRVLDTSWGNVTMRLYPVSVQGDSAASQMTEALKYFNDKGAADVIILGRGGGSFEDLNCFNDEKLVRTVHRCNIPIISAVGHENDFSLCDFAADVREATPSTAAKRAVANKAQELEKLSSFKSNILNRTRSLLDRYSSLLAKHETKVSALNPNSMINQIQQQLDMIQLKIANSINSNITYTQQIVNSYKQSFEVLNPQNTLKRGFAIIEDNKKNILKDVKDICKAKDITINMHNGRVSAQVVED